MTQRPEVVLEMWRSKLITRREAASLFLAGWESCDAATLGSLVPDDLLNVFETHVTGVRSAVIDGVAMFSIGGARDYAPPPIAYMDTVLGIVRHRRGSTE